MSTLTRLTMCIMASWLNSQSVSATISGCCCVIFSVMLPQFSLMVADTVCHSMGASSGIWACMAGNANDEWAYEQLRSIQSRVFIVYLFTTLTGLPAW